MAEPGGQHPWAGVLDDLVPRIWIAQAANVAATLRIADLVADGGRTVEELAEATRTHAPTLFRVLRALASVGVFAQNDDGRFVMTPAAERLLDRPQSERAWFMMMGAPWHWGTWGELLGTVRTGEPTFPSLRGMDLFDYLGKDPEAAQVFNDAMTSGVEEIGDQVADAYDFSGIDTLVDVGGGHGGLLIAILHRHLGLRGVVYELPAVAEGAARAIADAGLSERCTTSGGSFFESVVEGGDAYMAKSIIHDWDDERALKILGNIRRVIPPKGRLLLVERVLPGGNDPSLGKLLDLEMLVMTSGGRERTAEEFARLYEQAGFALTRVIPVPPDDERSVIEGSPVG